MRQLPFCSVVMYNNVIRTKKGYSLNLANNSEYVYKLQLTNLTKLCRYPKLINCCQ